MTEYWNSKRNGYRATSWSNEPSLFAQSVIDYLPDGGKLIDLGAGMGQDSIYFAEHGFEVTSGDIVLDSDFSFPPTVTRTTLDIAVPLPFEVNTFDVVYAHLALHYFDATTTTDIFAEIYRILKPGGVLAFLVNSVNDPEYDTGNKIEVDYFETDGTKKRYFSVESAKNFAKNFEIILCDEEGDTYKDMAKGVRNLVRFIGKKPI